MAVKKEEKKETITPAKIREMRLAVNQRVDYAKTKAMYDALRDYCYETTIEVESRFAGLPILTPKVCPNGHSGRCDTCDYLVQYSLQNKKAYCLRMKGES